MNNQRLILYISTRSLGLEREAEIQAARNEGYEIIMADTTKEIYKNYELRHFIQISLTEPEQATQIILDYLQQNNLKPNGVVGWGDNAVLIVGMVGTALNLRCSSLSAIQNVRNKINTRSLLQKLIPEANPRFAVISDQESFAQALKQVGTPCILKPAGASGGRGITRIKNLEEAFSKYREFRHLTDPKLDITYTAYADRFLLEEELTGSEHSVAGIVVDSKVIVFAVVDKLNDFSVPIQYQNSIPSQLPDSIQETMITIARKAVEITGIDWCGFHVDMIVADNQPKVLEVGGRLGGECINSHLIPLSNPDNGLHPYSVLMHVIQGKNSLEKEDYHQDIKKKVGMRALLPPKAGYIEAIYGVKNILNNPNTCAFLQVRKEGDTCYLPIEKYNSYAIGYCVAQCEIEENINATFDVLTSSFSVSIKAK